MKKTNKILITIIITILFLTSANSVLAVADDVDVEVQSSKNTASTEQKSYKLNTPIGTITSVDNFPEYIDLWLNFIVGAAGIMATAMIMYAGLKWLTSRGNSGVISDSKEKIISAVAGLVLAFLSYTILQLINPKLTTIGVPDLPKADPIVSETSSEGNNPVLPENSGSSKTYNEIIKSGGFNSSDLPVSNYTMGEERRLPNGIIETNESFELPLTNSLFRTLSKLDGNDGNTEFTITESFGRTTVGFEYDFTNKIVIIDTTRTYRN